MTLSPVCGCGEFYHHSERHVSKVVSQTHETGDLCPGRLCICLPCATAARNSGKFQQQPKNQIPSSENRSYLEPRVGFCLHLSFFREEFTSSSSLITTPRPESAGISLPFVNVWLWAGCLVRLTLALLHLFLYFWSWTMHTFLLTFHRGRSCQHHHHGHDRKQTISFLQTLLEICHSSYIISKKQATVAANSPFTRAGRHLCWSDSVFQHSHFFLFTQTYFIVYLMDFKNLRIGSYLYPDWTYVLGCIITVSLVLIVPLFALLQVFMTPGTIREVSINLLHSLPLKWADF